MEAVTIWIRRDGWKIFRYGVSGVSGAIIQVFFLYIFVEVFALWYLYGVVLAYLVALVIVFSLQKFWTFQDYSINHIHRQSLSYTLISLCALFLNILFMYVLVNVIGIWYIVSQIIVVGLVGIGSFFLNKTFTFNGDDKIKSLPHTTKICPICSSDDTGMYCEKNGHTLYCCFTCGFIFVSPIPDDLHAVYGKEYFHNFGKGDFGYSNYDRDKAHMKHVFEKYLDELEEVSREKIVLDVGCATGYFLDMAKERGWKTYGVEISEHASREALSRGHDVHMGTLPDFDATKKVSVVTMWDVFEHVDNPRGYLEAAYALLDDGGHIAINTVDASSLWALFMGKRWHLIVPPEHLHYYSTNNLKLLLGQAGFKVLKVRKFWKRFSLRYFFMMGYRWQGLKIWKYCADFFEGPFWRKVSVPVNFRDNVFVIAQKVDKK